MNKGRPSFSSISKHTKVNNRSTYIYNLVIHFGVRLLSGAKYMVDPLPGCVTGNICKLPNDTSNIGNVTRIIVGDTFL